MASRVGGSTASDLMDFLQKTRKKTPEEEERSSAGIGSSFASVMAQLLNPQANARPSSIEDEATTTAYSGGHADLSQYVNQSKGYKTFRDKITNLSFDWYSSDMIDPATGSLNQKGLDYTYKCRLDTVQSILPNSIEECDALYANSEENLVKYTSELLERNGLTMVTNLQNNWLPTGLSVWGVYLNSQSDEMLSMIRSDAGQEVIAMAEEFNLYRAISTLASNNKAFHESYNADPEKAVHEYSRHLGKLMESTDMPNMPYVNNRSENSDPVIFDALEYIRNRMQ